MRIRLKVLPLAALFMMWGGSGFAAADPFDAEHFLAPYGEVASLLIPTTPEAIDEAANAALNLAAVGIIKDFPDERFVPLVAAEETLGVADDPVELAFRPDNFLADEAEVAAIIAAELASLSETTGSVDVAERLDVACLDGEEDR